MKRLFAILAAGLAMALVLAGGAVALNRIVYGRSLKATLYEFLLRRRFATDRTAEEELRRLEAVRQAGEAPYALPSGLKLDSEIEESDLNGLQVFTLNGGAPGPLVLYLHGGAYVNGFNAHQWRFMDRLARSADCEIAAPAYHLAPHADYARAYVDLTALYRALLVEKGERALFLIGDSAGGGLALGLAEYLAGQGAPLPERLILFSPWVDVSMDNPEITDYLPVEPMLHFDLVKVHGQCWAGEADPRFWMVSPLFGDMAGLPPVTMYCGTRELLYPDILLAKGRLDDAGVEATLNVGRGLNHDWPLMPIPEADAAFRDIVALLRG